MTVVTIPATCYMTLVTLQATCCVTIVVSEAVASDNRRVEPPVPKRSSRKKQTNHQQPSVDEPEDDANEIPVAATKTSVSRPPKKTRQRRPPSEAEEEPPNVSFHT